MADSRAGNFPETSYGIVKRLQTIEAWTAGVAERLGTPSLSILDFGCGTGDHVTYPLAYLGHRVLGMDMQPSIKEAQRRYRLPNLSFRTGRLETLIEEGVVVDLIICSEVLEHLHQPQDCLRLMRRLLKQNGALIITTPNGYGSYEMLCRLQRGLAGVGIDQVMRGLVHARRRMHRRSIETDAPDFEARLMRQYPQPGELHLHVDPCRRAYCERCPDKDCPIRQNRSKPLVPDLESLIDPDEPSVFR